MTTPRHINGPHARRVDKAEGSSSSDGPNIVGALDGIRASLERAHAEYHKELRGLMATTYLAAWVLSHNSKLWAQFCSAKYWAGVGRPARPTANHQADALRFVLRYVWGKSNAASKKASFYYRGLSRLVADGVEPPRVQTEVRKRGGFKKMAGSQTSGAPKVDDCPKPLIEVSPKKPSRSDLVASSSKVVKGGFAGSKTKDPQPETTDVMIKAQFPQGQGFSVVPRGCDFTLKGTLREVGPTIFVAVRQLYRD